ERSPVTEIELWIQASRDLRELTEIGVETKAARWNWPWLGVESDGDAVKLRWREGIFTAQASTHSLKSVGHLNETGTQVERQAQLSDFHFEARAGVDLKPFKIGNEEAPQITFQASGKSFEMMKGDQYLGLPLDVMPAGGTYDPATQVLDFELGKGR